MGMLSPQILLSLYLLNECKHFADGLPPTKGAIGTVEGFPVIRSLSQINLLG
jgi:hypothetical protein